MKVDSANELLSGHTDVLSVTFTSEPPLWSCAVSVVLLDASRDGPGIVLRCSDVSRFSLSELGGGLTQLLCLRVRDVAHEGRDRVRFVVEDLERESMWLECDDFSVVAR